MAAILEVDHVTTYSCANPVTVGEHRLMILPRAGHEVTVLRYSVDVCPDSDLGWARDVFSNSVTAVRPRASAATLCVTCRFAIAHHGIQNLELPVAPHAQRYPFDCTHDERRDLGATRARRRPLPGRGPACLGTISGTNVEVRARRVDA